MQLLSRSGIGPLMHLRERVSISQGGPDALLEDGVSPAWGQDRGSGREAWLGTFVGFAWPGLCTPVFLPPPVFRTLVFEAE